MQWIRHGEGPPWHLPRPALRRLLQEDQFQSDLPAAWFHLLALSNYSEAQRGKETEFDRFSSQEFAQLTSWCRAFRSPVPSAWLDEFEYELIDDNEAPSDVEGANDAEFEADLALLLQEFDETPLINEVKDESPLAPSTEAVSNPPQLSSTVNGSKEIPSGRTVSRISTGPAFVAALAFLTIGGLAGWLLSSVIGSNSATGTVALQREQRKSERLLTIVDGIQAKNLAYQATVERQAAQIKAGAAYVQRSEQGRMASDAKVRSIRSELDRAQAERVALDRVRKRQDSVIRRLNGEVLAARSVDGDGIGARLRDEFRNGATSAGGEFQGTPAGTAIRESTPEFQWNPESGPTTLEVFLVGTRTRVRSAIPLAAGVGSYRLSTPLPRGRAYEWVISRSDRASSGTRVPFYVLSASDAERVGKALASSTLTTERAAVLYREGLYDELATLGGVFAEDAARKKREILSR